MKPPLNLRVTDAMNSPKILGQTHGTAPRKLLLAHSDKKPRPYGWGFF